MKSKKNRRLRKCNNGVSPFNDVNWRSQIPNPTVRPAMQSAMNEGTNNAMDAAGKRLAGQATKGGNIAGSVVNAIGAGVQTWADPTLDPTKRAMTTGPLVYERQEYVNNEEQLKKLKKENTGNALKSIGTGAAAGAAIGSVIPVVGTVIGGVVGAVGGAVSGVFGASKRKKEMKKMISNENKRIDTKNLFNQSQAHSTVLQQQYNAENEDYTDDALYNKGKTKFNNGKTANALVGKGETIVDGYTGEMTEVSQGSAVGNDDVQAVIKPEDAIAGNMKNPNTGNTFAQDMKPLTRMEGKLKRNIDRNIKSIAKNTEDMVKRYSQPLAQTILTQQAEIHANKGKSKKYNLGKVAEYTVDTVNAGVSLAPSIYNMIQGTKQYDTTSANELYSPNKNANAAIDLMSKRRYNVQPEIEQLRGLETRQRYNARQLGSEGGINRAMDVAGAIGTQRAISNVYAKKQNVDNQYIGDQAQMMAQLGSQEASSVSNAMSQAYDINARNKAMQAQYKAAGLSGFSQYAQLTKKNMNQKRMDDMRMRVLEKYYNMGTTQDNINYIWGNQ